MTHGDWQHPDPAWWKRCEIAGESMDQADLCDECGHIRGMHGRMCMSRTEGLAAPLGVSCLCMASPISGIFRNPRTLHVSR